MDRGIQKRPKTPQKSKSKKKNKKNQTQVRDKSFVELYPESPELFPSTSYLTMTVDYRGTSLKVKVTSGVQNQHIYYLFHREIYRHLLQIGCHNPLRRTAEVVGFQSNGNDLLLDYQISIGKGILLSNRSFTCLQYVESGRLKKYKICKCLAIGGFSKVYLVRSLRDGNFYAMKVMLKKFIAENQKQNIIQNERDICCRLNHPFVVKLNHCFQTHSFVCFILDYCPGGQLFYHLKQVKRMSEQNARFYFIEILYGLMYLHQNKIIYRDLKPQNLLIGHDGHIKIADFGLSKANMDARDVTHSFCGSTQYMPPEMILREGHSFGVDYYTLGALLYELVTGLPPFYSRDQEQIKCAIVNQQLTFPSTVSLSSQIKNLLNSLLNKNQKLRIGSLKGLKQILFHPWVGRINSEMVLNKKLEPPYIPSIEEFNFDENQLGHDEAEFTRKLKTEYMIPANRQKLVFQDFDFMNEYDIRPEVKRVYEKYPDKKTVHLQQSHSMKCLKSSPSKLLKRQASSPYLTRRPDTLDRHHDRNSSLGYRHRSKNIRMSNSISQKKLSHAHSHILVKKSLAFRKQKQNAPYNPFAKKKQLVYNSLKQK